MLLFRLLFAFSILVATFFVGVNVVLPKSLLRVGDKTVRSTAADYGMRFDPLSFSDCTDTLNLHASMIYPFDKNPNERIDKHSLIVLHPLRQSWDQYYHYVRNFTASSFNVICLEMRAHGRSNGDVFTLGKEEARDISELINLILERYPDHSFGIYAIKDSGNIALKALQNDKRIRYAILEDYYESSFSYFESFNSKDLITKSALALKYFYNLTLAENKIDREDVSIDLSGIEQHILLSPSNSESKKRLKTFRDYPNTCLQASYNQVLPNDMDKFSTMNSFILDQIPNATIFMEENYYTPLKR